MPKFELHVHLLGSASVPTVLELARRHPDRGVPTEEDALRDFYEFTDFAHFIDVYIAVNSLVTSTADIEGLIGGLAQDLAQQEVRYAEVTVTAASHLMMGIDPDELAEALTRGRERAAQEHSVVLAWVFDISGELGHEAGLRTIEWVEHWAPEGSVGFGLGGPEIGVARPQFAGVFNRAKDFGLHSVPHAGETTGANTIWDAIHSLGAERIGHGIAAASDPQLMRYLAEHNITLEVCPTSNLRTKAVARIEDHPLPRLMAEGVPVTINSDDPGMFHTTLNEENWVTHNDLGVDVAGLTDLVRTAIGASFAPQALKKETVSELDAYVSATTS